MLGGVSHVDDAAPDRAETASIELMPARWIVVAVIVLMAGYAAWMVASWTSGRGGWWLVLPLCSLFLISGYHLRQRRGAG